ncbi:MAG: glycoside hydrolase family 32 protein [Muribaculaceae bacterium]|nr:glycoside hydrolase family 32 protein [Muribaculaceae bacterium]
MKSLTTACILLLAAAATATAEEVPLYSEPYRPQYHFTPAHRWIGDPCGTIRYNGRYMAYSWGAAESPDLLHWKELNHMAIKNLPDGTSAFTGSVAIDREGTSGHGKNAWVAAFTSYDEASRKQSQSIAFSRDSGLTFHYYDLNPVIDIWSTEFRDPTVIRHEPSGQWVMLVAKALEKKVAFYRSTNLTDWEHTSDFGPMGDSERSWECPDLFRLPVDGDSTRMKWVLVVSVNWAREQYFTGEFDGVSFTPDSTCTVPRYVDHGLDYYASRVFQDYDCPDGPVHTIGWLNTWDYAQQAPMAFGKGIWSIPRRYTLRSTPGEGLRLCQQPAEVLGQIRQKPWKANMRLTPGVRQLPEIGRMDNTYELEAEFDIRDNSPFGMNLCEGADGRKVTLQYDPASQTLLLDRTNSTDAIIPGFDRMTHVKVSPDAGGRLRVHIFVDHSTMEIFVNDGHTTMSLLTYAGTSQTGASLFSLGSATRGNFTAWPLKPVVGGK